jgi:hypothetical protein
MKLCLVFTPGGMQYRIWLRYYATSRKFAGSIPDYVIGFLNWPNPSSRITVSGSIQPLIKICTKNLLGDKGRTEREADLTAIFEPIIWKMWKPRRLIILWASIVCYRDSFTLFSRQKKWSVSGLLILLHALTFNIWKPCSERLWNLKYDRTSSITLPQTSICQWRKKLWGERLKQYSGWLIKKTQTKKKTFQDLDINYVKLRPTHFHYEISFWIKPLNN